MRIARAVPFAALALIPRMAVAQDETDLWLRYALRVPLNDHWTWHGEPDYRTRIGPDAGSFTQWLFRNDLQRTLDDVNTVGIGMVFLRTTFKGDAPPVYEWRPQLTLFTRPRLGQRDLLLRTRAEWRQQRWAGTDDLPEVNASTLRCRAMAQYDLTLARAPWGMRKGLRAQAEILLRGYTSADLGVYDHLRLSAAWVMASSERLELEGTWMWMLRDTGAWQQWLRLGVQHRMGRQRSPA